MSNHGSATGSGGKIKYPASFYNYSAKLDLIKINKPILQLWITNEITSLLGFEDEIVTNTVINLFGLSTTDDGTSGSDHNSMSNQQLNEMVDPKQAHVVLSGFFNEDVALQFCVTLWDYMIDASQQPTGIPRQIIEAKKRQLQQEKEQQQQSAVNVSKPQPESDDHRHSKNIQNQPRKRRNRWDNNEVPAGEIRPDHEHQQQQRSEHNIIPPEVFPSSESPIRVVDTRPTRDEYGRNRKQERDYSKDDRDSVVKGSDSKYSSDRRHRRKYDDDDHNESRRDYYDDDRRHRRRMDDHDRPSSDRRHHDRYDDDYYHDKQQKRKRHY